MPRSGFSSRGATDGLRRLVTVHRDYLADRYRRPQPRNALAAAVRDFASAAMDVSDGLAGDLTKMLGLASLSARIDVTKVPLSRAALDAVRLAPELRETILSGGDDYEILRAVPPSSEAAFRDAAAGSGVPVARIGVARGGGAGRIFTNEDGRAITLGRLSYSHR